MAAAGSVLDPLLPETSARHNWHGLHGSAVSLAIVAAAKKFSGLTLVITNDNNQAFELGAELDLFSGNTINIRRFADLEVLPYDNIAPHQDIVSTRLKTLKSLSKDHSGILLVSIQALLQRLPPRTYIDAHSLDFYPGQTIDFSSLTSSLEKLGYHRVQQVMEHGEYTVRGEIVDIFPMGQKLPLRLDFFDDEIEQIKIFDPESQRSLNQLDKVHLLPGAEIPLSAPDIEVFKQNWQKIFGAKDAELNPVYRNVTNGLLAAGIESYLPLFFKKTACLFDYLPDNFLCINFAGLTENISNVHNDYQERFSYKSQLDTVSLLPPSDLILPEEEFYQYLEKTSRISIQNFKTITEEKNSVDFDCKALPSLKLNQKTPEPLKPLLDLVEPMARFLFVSESLGLRNAFKNMLEARDIYPASYTNFNDFIKDSGTFGISSGTLQQGFYLADSKLYLIPESALFTAQGHKPKRRKARVSQAKIISNLTELNLADPIVHLDHGVGRYRGLKTLTVAGQVSEFLVLEYANNDILYVPVTSLQLVHRYLGADSDNAPLHRLGSNQWQKAQSKAKRQAHDVAVELLEIYAKREARTRPGILTPDEQCALFAAEFPFEPTADQADAIEAITQDMLSMRPMDRLICGDVGFGKTEVAMRAAFLAVQNSKQVAVLVPTTLLAQQHFNTFSDRFANWPVNIEILSRFNTGKVTTETIQRIKSGAADIVVGTHKLLSKDVNFKNLGLLIIDEEHRFGVKQKDNFKALRSEIDILALTATPIPRTLNLSISGIRDLSIIATAPESRVAIKTMVQEWDADIIRESVMREVRRGGQVYFVHNRVESINRVGRELKALLPEISLGIAHGQMRELELENVMKDFYQHKFNILLCTTIIENGIDIPSANTIIINNADRFGLAQLYQLRGRVGRSYHRAYAYLLVTAIGSVSANAKKRLQAVESMQELGVGFSLAVQDLEIRGAGELLGAGQSGQIHEIGFEMYNEILNRAVADLKAGAAEKPTYQIQQLEVDLGEPALIPENFIPDINIRLVTYKRIANTENLEKINDLQIELVDRFGLLPQEVKNLFIETFA